jgi:hypothetical protein
MPGGCGESALAGAISAFILTDSEASSAPMGSGPGSILWLT